MKTGIELIAQERKEQIEKHGRTIEHDRTHGCGELAIIAACLCCMETDATVEDPNGFGSKDDAWGLMQRLNGQPIHALKVAGACIAAEIDRRISKAIELGDKIQ